MEKRKNLFFFFEQVKRYNLQKEQEQAFALWLSKA
jgi:hypothetical protein